MTANNVLRQFTVLLWVATTAQIALASDSQQLERLLPVCKSCHGEQLQGKYPIHAPALAGQLSSYLAQQLKQYRADARGAHLGDVYGQQMALITKTLTDDDVEQLSAYMASAKSTGNDPDVSSAALNCEPKTTAGERVYQSCIACHGAHGEGNITLSSPNLAILHPSYVAEQLRNYQLGYRGAVAGASQGAAMRAIAAGLSDTDIDQVTEYICTFAAAPGRAKDLTKNLAKNKVVE